MCPKYFSYLCFIFFTLFMVFVVQKFLIFMLSHVPIFFFSLFIAFVPCLEVSIQRLYKYSSMLSSSTFMSYFFTFKASGIYLRGMMGFLFFSQLASQFSQQHSINYLSFLTHLKILFIIYWMLRFTWVSFQSLEPFPSMTWFKSLILEHASFSGGSPLFPNFKSFLLILTLLAFLMNFKIVLPAPQNLLLRFERWIKRSE